MVVILDYGMGNVGSHTNMLRKIGCKDVQVSSDPDVIEMAQKLIIPGVGSFDAGMNSLRERGLLEIINKKVLIDQVPVLGICLGMHLFAKSSEEGNSSGLGWLDARVVRFSFADRDVKLRIPHMGWNTISLTSESRLFNGMSLVENRFYFVHSYHMDTELSGNIAATCNYGYNFPVVIQAENIFGVQFHPEKSHKFGMNLYRNFIEI